MARVTIRHSTAMSRIAASLAGLLLAGTVAAAQQKPADPKAGEAARPSATTGAEVYAYANLFFGQFVVLMADESQTTVGGCSTDSSVRFIKELEKRFGVEFFNRTSLAFVVKDKVQLLPMNQVPYAISNGFINEDTVYFNNLVSTKESLEKDWIIPVRDIHS